LADIMRDIIHEVLNKGKNKQAYEIKAIAVEEKAVSLPNISRPNYQRNRSYPIKEEAGVAQSGAPQSLSNIPRPNYQRNKQQNRLQTVNPSPALATVVAKPSSPQAAQLNREFTENQVSALQRLTAAQIIQAPARFGNADRGEEPKLIGKTKNEEFVWFYPSAASRLVNGGNKNGTCAGIITRACGGNGLLFLMDEWLKSLPYTSYEILPHAVKVFSNDTEKMQQFLENAYLDLNRRRIQSNKIYKVEQPSPFLKQSLKIVDGVSAVLVEGICYFNSVALVERCFHKYPNATLDFDIKENELLITGQPSSVNSVVQQVKQDIEQLSL
jgi:hypothetical protein